MSRPVEGFEERAEVLLHVRNVPFDSLTLSEYRPVV
jgi:hypothetical protein